MIHGWQERLPCFEVWGCLGPVQCSEFCNLYSMSAQCQQGVNTANPRLLGIGKSVNSVSAFSGLSRGFCVFLIHGIDVFESMNRLVHVGKLVV